MFLFCAKDPANDGMENPSYDIIGQSNLSGPGGQVANGNNNDEVMASEQNVENHNEANYDVVS